MTNAEFRREMTGNMPTGSYDMAEQTFSIRELREELDMQTWDRIVLELDNWPRDEM